MCVCVSMCVCVFYKYNCVEHMCIVWIRCRSSFVRVDASGARQTTSIGGLWNTTIVSRRIVCQVDDINCIDEQCERTVLRRVRLWCGVSARRRFGVQRSKRLDDDQLHWFHWQIAWHQFSYSRNTRRNQRNHFKSWKLKNKKRKFWTHK